MGTWAEAGCGLAPSGRAAAGCARVPASKSEAIRALLLAACGRGEVGLAPLPAGDDVRRAMGAAEAFGARVVRADDGVRVIGSGGLLAPEVVEVGESGTLARVATAMAALAGGGGPTRIRGKGTLMRRRSPALFAALTGAGARLESVGEADGWDLLVHPVASGRCPSRLALVSAGSSQEVSALLMAAACAGREVTVQVQGRIPSRPYVDLTLAVLARFGVQVRESAAAAELHFEVTPGLVSPPSLAIEPDASLAAVALAAAVLCGGELQIEGLSPSSLQGDVRILDHLAAFGCRVQGDAGGLRAAGPVRRGARVDLAGEPDLAPVVAAIAAAAALGGCGPSVLDGLSTLPGKESDRLRGCAEALQRVGCSVDLDPAGSLAVSAQGKRSADLLLQPLGDHRMAFLHGLLGLVVAGVRCAEPACVAKSWPSFWDDMAHGGYRVLAGAGN